MSHTNSLLSLSEQMKDDRVQLPLGNAFQCLCTPGLTSSCDKPMFCEPGLDAFGTLRAASSTGSCPQLKHIL